MENTLPVDSSSLGRVFLGETSYPLSRPSLPDHKGEGSELREGLSVAWPFRALSQVCLPTESVSSSSCAHRKSATALGLASFFWGQVEGHFCGSERTRFFRRERVIPFAGD